MHDMEDKDLDIDMEVDLGPDEEHTEEGMALQGEWFKWRVEQGEIIQSTSIFDLTFSQAEELERIEKENYNVVHARECDMSSFSELWGITKDMDQDFSDGRDFTGGYGAAARSIILQKEELAKAWEEFIASLVTIGKNGREYPKGLVPKPLEDKDYIHDGRETTVELAHRALSNDLNRNVVHKTEPGFDKVESGKTRAGKPKFKLVRNQKIYQEIAGVTPPCAGLICTPDEEKAAMTETSLNIQRELTGSWTFAEGKIWEIGKWHLKGAPIAIRIEITGQKTEICECGCKMPMTRTTRKADILKLDYDPDWDGFREEPSDLKPQFLIRGIRSTNPQTDWTTEYAKQGSLWMHPKGSQMGWKDKDGVFYDPLPKFREKIKDILNRKAQGMGFRWESDAISLTMGENGVVPIRIYQHKTRKAEYKAGEVDLAGLEVKDLECRYWDEKSEKFALHVGPHIRDVWDARKLGGGAGWKLRGDSGHWACIAHGSYSRDKSLFLTISTKLSGREGGAIWSLDIETWGEGFIKPLLRSISPQAQMALALAGLARHKGRIIRLHEAKIVKGPKRKSKAKKA